MEKQGEGKDFRERISSKSCLEEECFDTAPLAQVSMKQTDSKQNVFFLLLTLQSCTRLQLKSVNKRH